MLRTASSSHSFVRSVGSARSTGRTSTVTPYCLVSRSANALSTSSRRAVMIRWCPRAASSVASASPMFCEAPVTTARASALGAGTGMGRTISWATMSESRPPAPTAGRLRVLAWALWDCGSTGIGAIVVTFVFSVYLTRSVGDDLPGDTTPASWLGWALFFSGVTVALLAPVTGVWVDAPHRRRRTLALLTAMVVLLTSAMSLIRDDASYLLAGLLLLGFAAACNDLASVPYNAMLRQLTTPETSGRVSGFGWAAGYVGSMALLLVVYAGFIAGDGPTAGLLDIPTADGQNVRAAMLVTAAWMAAFALPVLIAPPPADLEPPARSSAGVLGAYRKLWSDLVGEWRRDRNVVYYLLASAVFRDGLAGVFTFGAVLGVNVYGVSDGRCTAVRCHRQRGGRHRGGNRRTARRPCRLKDRHPGLAGGDDRRGHHADGVVRCRRVLGVRAAAVPVHRADAGVGAHAAAADDRPRQGGCGVRPLHHDGPGRVRPSRPSCSPRSSPSSARIARASPVCCVVLAAGFIAMLAVRVPRRSAVV